MSGGSAKACVDTGEGVEAILAEQRKRLEEIRITSPLGRTERPAFDVATTRLQSDQRSDSEGIANWENPVCLIENRDSGMMINEEAAKLLSKVPGPIIAVAIVGLYRTGKSFLLNLLAGRTDGFPLGNTTNACTKGIWTWLLNHPTKKECFMLLMDTEGLGDVRKGDVANDSQLYVLAILLSSILVHNSTGVIDNDALEKLQFITKMAEEINTESGGENDGLDLRKYFPTFVWAVRDFTLKLVDEKGNSTTSTYYLESALKQHKGMTQKIKDFNFIRECIREFFPQRECFTFPYPIPDANDMDALERMTLQQLTPKFREQAQKFKQFIYDEGTTKAYQGEPVTGRTFCELARTYLKTIKEKGVPCIQSSVEISSRQVNTRAIEESVRIYQNCMNKYQPPVEFLATLIASHYESVNEAVYRFVQFAFYDKNDEYLCELKKRLDEEYRQICSKHETESAKRCKACLEENSSKLRDSLTARHYIQPNGYMTYRQDLEALEKAYTATAKLGFKRSDCWDQFLKEQQTIADAIQAADSSLTEERKRREEQSREHDELKRRLKSAEEQLEAKTLEWNARLNSQADEMYQFHVKLEKEAQLFTREHDSLLSRHSDMLHSGFQIKADDMLNTIEVQKMSRNQKKREAFYKTCEQRLESMQKDHRTEMQKALEEQKRFQTKMYNTEVSNLQDALQKLSGDATEAAKRADLEKKLQEAKQNNTHQLKTLEKEAQVRTSEFDQEIRKIRKELTSNFKGRGKDNSSFLHKFFSKA